MSKIYAMHELSKYTDEFEQLFKDNYKHFYYYALKFVKNKEEAKDIVSSLFEYIWENYASLKTSGTLTPFIYASLRNRCIDHLRHQQTIIKHHSILLEENSFFEEDKYEEPDKLVSKLKETLDKLPEQMRKVVVKCFLEGKKYKEVSEEMNISINTVKTHISRALNVFRNNLKN